MNGQCPKCGGSDLLQITPGFLECRSLVVGLMHQADGSSVPAGHLCGHRFQVSAPVSVELCACGRQSIGRCADCARALCGQHGTADGLFLCGDCLRHRDQRRRDEETAAAKQQQAAAARELAETERRRAAVSAKVVSAQDLGEMMTLIVENIVDMRQRIFPGREAPEDRWLDGRGAMWRSMSSVLELRKGPGPTFTRGEINWVVLPRGEPFRATGCAQSLGLVLLPNAKMRSVVSGMTLSQPSSQDLGYARVVAAIVQARLRQAS